MNMASYRITGSLIPWEVMADGAAGILPHPNNSGPCHAHIILEVLNVGMPWIYGKPTEAI